MVSVITSWMLVVVAATQEPSQFIRVADGRALQTAVATYEHPATHRRVVLVGAVHVADRRYYRDIQAILDDHALVLVEGVRGVGPPPLMGPQERLVGSLGLVSQRTGIDYARAHFRNADMQWSELKGLLGDRAAMLVPPAPPTWFRVVFRPVEALVVDLPWLASHLPGATQMPHVLGIRRAFANVLTRGGSGLSAPGGPVDPVLVDTVLIRRNAHAFTELDRALDEGAGDIALFWGAAHLPDMHDRLLARGFVPSDLRWVDAWQLEPSCPLAP